MSPDTLSIESLVFQYLKAHSTPKVLKKFCQEVNLDASNEESKAENLPKLSELLKEYQNEKNSSKNNNNKKRKKETEQVQENVSQGLTKKPKLDLSGTECYQVIKLDTCPENVQKKEINVLWGLPVLPLPDMVILTAPVSIVTNQDISLVNVQRPNSETVATQKAIAITVENQDTFQENVLIKKLDENVTIAMELDICPEIVQ